MHKLLFELLCRSLDGELDHGFVFAFSRDLDLDVDDDRPMLDRSGSCLINVLIIFREVTEDLEDRLVRCIIGEEDHRIINHLESK